MSRIAHEKAEITKNESALALNHTLEKIAELEKFINNSGSTPSAIRELAAKVNVFYHYVLHRLTAIIHCGQQAQQASNVCWFCW